MTLYRSARITVVLIATVLVAAAAIAQTPSLNIMLTNDDGFDAPGLRIMRDTLIAAGHHVFVVAPATDFSGAGASMTSGVIKFEQMGDGIWAVHGTPADSASIGIAYVLRDTRLDLVVSGTNRGQNLGASANSSGTVGAAIVSSVRGVPAIAVSAGIGTAEATTAAYRQAATLTRQLIALLVAARAGTARILPERIVVNINCPAVAFAPSPGIVIAPLSARASYTRQYSATGTDGEVRAQLVPATAPTDETTSDLAYFTRGYTTISILDGDLGLDVARAPSALAGLLTAFTSAPAASR